MFLLTSCVKPDNPGFEIGFYIYGFSNAVIAVRSNVDEHELMKIKCLWIDVIFKRYNNIKKEAIRLLPLFCFITKFN